jgi:hypothetical protein
MLLLRLDKGESVRTDTVWFAAPPVCGVEGEIGRERTIG